MFKTFVFSMVAGVSTGLYTNDMILALAAWIVVGILFLWLSANEEAR